MHGQEVAAAIHEAWRVLAAQEGWAMQPHFDEPCAELAKVDKWGNRAPGRRIPASRRCWHWSALDSTKREDCAEVAVPEEELLAILDQNIERMAEAEKDGWMDHRARNDWQCGASGGNARKLHSATLPYSQLPEREKGKDGNSMRHYQDFAARTRHRIVRLA